MHLSLVAATSTILLLACSLASAADDYRDLFAKKSFSHANANANANANAATLPYRLMTPAGDWKSTDKTYPLVVFWHGAGERGEDNEKQLVHGMQDFASDAVRQKYPAFVVAPQCPRGSTWSNIGWTAEERKLQPEPTTPMRLSLELIDRLQAEYPIDPKRIYICGLSMGGFGTWDALARRPEAFAAAVPICGGGSAASAEKFANVPIWCFHGSADPVVKPELSREMIAALKAAGGKPKYTEYEGVGHDSWTQTFANPKLYEWLFAQQKP